MGGIEPIKWKVYNTFFNFQLKRIVTWDGILTWALTKKDAIRIRDKQLEESTDNKGIYSNYRNLDAVPEGWEIPLQIKYEQKELF